MTQHDDHCVDLSQPLKDLRRRAFIRRTMQVIVATLGFAAITLIFQPTVPPLFGPLILGIMFGVGLGQLPFSKAYKNINEKEFLLHLNRSDKGMEESGQLLLRSRKKLSVIQQLQQDKITKRFNHIIVNKQIWLPPLAVGNMFLTAIILLVGLYAGFYFVLRDDSADPNTRETVSILEPATIVSASLNIIPPTYTGLKSTTQPSMDIEAIEGSQISWAMKFSRDDGVFVLRFRGGDDVTLKSVDNSFRGTIAAENTGLYTVVHKVGGVEAELPDIYSLSIVRDQKPMVRIIDPKTTTVEIAKNGKTTFTSSALVSDDFGITKVNILTSVAKGSGEAVKFRDKIFEFDGMETGPNGNIYTREWDLKALEMEPGDEVYFTVQAWDNKEPDPNMAKSGTVIVRWLDEAPRSIAAEGIVVDFIPEYFKSQRQIIIETEQLIADKDSLDAQTFKDTSYSLGHSQSDLKQKYGQYLGDEFGEGPGDQVADMGGVDDDDHEEEGERPEVGHEHDENNTDAEDKTGKDDLIARFGHGHGDADVGPVSKTDPKSYMKRAVSIMWDAELHLMQADPVKALPFEYEAMRYLKLAKQADRIYVKRLGFEPPPVTEERRLTGELEDIKSAQQSFIKGLDDEDDLNLIGELFHVLNLAEGMTSALSESQKKLVSKASTRFSEMAETRPVMIKYAATLEKILQANSFALSNCEGCVSTLTKALWKMMKTPIGPPAGRAGYYLLSDKVITKKSNKGERP